MALNNYVILYKAKQGVSPENVRVSIKANDKADARFRANKESGLKEMYLIESVTEMK